MATAEAPAKAGKLKLKNVGPVSLAEAPIPEHGIVICRGKSGCGKSTTLRAIDSLISGGKPDFSVKDDELHAEVSGMGVELRIGRRIDRKGELEWQGISGVAIDELVDPGIDNVQAADAARIKALVRIVGVAPDPSLFYDLVGGKEEFELILPGIESDGDDLLKLAGRVKRGFEAAARLKESAADEQRGHAKACREAASGVDTSAECDNDKLQRALEAAVSHKTELDGQVNAWARAKKSADTARKEIEKVEGGAANLASVEAAKERIAAAQKEKDLAISELSEMQGLYEEARKAFDEAEKRLRRAEAFATNTTRELTAATDALASAESLVVALDGWRKAIADAESVSAPTDDELNASVQAVTAARNALQQVEVVKRARESLVKETEHLANAESAGKEAARLRAAAQSIDGVLSEIVSQYVPGLRVEADRLVTTTPERGKTYFAELSDGQRYDFAIDLLVNRVSGRGLGVIQQRAWGEIQPKTKLEIAAKAHEKKVLLYTAEVTDDENLTFAVM